MSAALNSIIERGATPFLVGGCVRDSLMGMSPKDIDIEVHDMEANALQDALSCEMGQEVNTIGKSFGVFKVRDGNFDFDVSIPRTDVKTGRGHRGFNVRTDPHMGFSAACERRDLTINAIGYDLSASALVDPHGGLADLRAGRLRAVSDVTFAEDPLRVLRVAQFAARLDMQPDDDLLELCAAIDISEVAAERQYVEFEKLLTKGVRPSVGLDIIRKCGQLHQFPELDALRGVPQDKKWHPEGDVWIHTLMVVDAAAEMRDGSQSDMALMLGALCHDFGKPSATTVEPDGTIRSRGHAEAGIEPARSFLERLRASAALCRQVELLVDCHLEPEMLPAQNAGPKAYRKLARKLGEAGVGMDLLERVARADQLGRTTELARKGLVPGCDAFLKNAADANVERKPVGDVVMGRHLIERGWTPNPRFGAFLNLCREVQYETGWTDVSAIIDETLGREDRSATLGR